ncbi:MAG TPA: DUF3886 domain-containing protein [Sporosarcina sp.]|nr:DUF3886 domain-containing protein [Sporosarcina sp.]
MAKRKRQQRHQTNKQGRQKEEGSLQVEDALDEDILHQLQAAKNQLRKVAEAEAKAEQERRKREREEREKNKSFEELLETYGDQGGKFS